MQRKQIQVLLWKCTHSVVSNLDQKAVRGRWEKAQLVLIPAFVPQKGGKQSRAGKTGWLSFHQGAVRKGQSKKRQTCDSRWWAIAESCVCFVHDAVFSLGKQKQQSEVSLQLQAGWPSGRRQCSVEHFGQYIQYAQVFVSLRPFHSSRREEAAVFTIL